MCNYPEDFKGTNMDGRPEEELPDAYNRVLDAQDAYRECLAAITAAVKKHRFLLLARDVEAIMEGIGEALASEVDSETDQLADHGYSSITAYPDDHKKLCTDAAEELADALRIKPIDWQKELPNILRPVTQGEIGGTYA